MPQKSFVTLAALSLASFVWAGPVAAQTPATPKEPEAGAAVRGRRAADAAAKEAPAAKPTAAEGAAPKDAESKVADSAAAEPEGDGEAKVVEAGGVGEGSLEDLRARIEGEKNAAARARLQRELVERLAAAGQKAEAVASLRAMLAEERFDPPFFYNVGNQLARLGESGAAVEAYRKAVGQRRGHYSRAQHNLGVVLARLGRWEEAEAALTAALRQENFTYAEASYSLGRLHALRGEAGLAIEEWQRTLRLKPDHAPAAVGLARALAEDGDPKEALAVLDSFEARALRRGDAAPREVAVARGEIIASVNLLEAGGSPEAARHTASANARESASAVGLGRDAGRRRDALRPLSVSAQTYELLRRARGARESARHGDAAALYRDAIRSNGGYFAPANLELGYALAEMRRTGEAIESLLVVVRRSGTRYPVAFYHLGRLYEHEGQLAPAGESFARAAELMGEEAPQVFNDLSRVREKEGKAAEALAAMETYVRAMDRLGDVPVWAHERVNKLRGKAETRD
jgi:tetratricopeptide (TPR) repeat protein